MAKLWKSKAGTHASEDEQKPVNIKIGSGLLSHVDRSARNDLDLTGVLSVLNGAGFNLKHPGAARVGSHCPVNVDMESLG